MPSTWDALMRRSIERESVHFAGSSGDGELLDWYPSQVKGPVDDEVQEGKSHETEWWKSNLCLPADLISTIEFNEDGELLAVGDKGGRIVVFQREQQVIDTFWRRSVRTGIFQLMSREFHSRHKSTGIQRCHRRVIVCEAGVFRVYLGHAQLVSVALLPTE